ncbi:MAG: hypothetical protein HC903_18905 [Methylacidiphilales bacterium]|nr:hypothetical protein [Candidatus Methylacidiphilales bacterium]NJR18136.1 hypothetical protein [Calothrix sp. CSU_2_0]
MSTLKISELRPAGSELFQDSESFLNELNDQEIGAIAGGGYKVPLTSVVYVNSQITVSQGISLETISIVSVGKAPIVVKNEVRA